MERTEGGVYFTSFPASLRSGVSGVIDQNHAVVTVFSGSSGSGGHTSMFLEMFENGNPKSYFIDLTTNGTAISISKSPAQIFPPNGNAINMSLPKGGNLLALARSHHHSYPITGAQAAALLLAVQRFKDKVQAGRYAYVKPGGAIGRVLTRPGKRGVNCADFAIKVLSEAGITNISSLAFNTPYRVAK